MSGPERIEHNPALIPPIETGKTKAPSEPARTVDGKTFEQLLRTKVAASVATPEAPAAAPATVKFSAHAAARLHQRGIALEESHLARLETAVDKAAAKGSRESR